MRATSTASLVTIRAALVALAALAWLAAPSLPLVAQQAAARADAAGPPPPAAAADDALRDLPLTVVAGRGGAAGTLAVLLTGDGGWAPLDRQIADSLSAHGITVVALNSRSYFSRQRDPAGASADLARVMRRYTETSGSHRVVLVGYSRGADVLPFLVTRLPPEVASQVVLVVLIGPAHNANFKFHLIDLVSNHARKDDLATVPEIERLAPLPVLCVYGSDEKDSACPLVPPGTVHAVEMPGGHHFDGRYGEIARHVLDALSR